MDNPIILKNGKLCKLNQDNLSIYNNLDFEIIHKIEFKEKKRIISVVELENGDLIILSEGNKSQDLLIYRLKNNNYFLFQKIIIKIQKKKVKNVIGCKIMNIETDNKLLNIKALPDNKFICISKKGFIIFAMNNGNYEQDVEYNRLEGIKDIEYVNKILIITRKIHYGPHLHSPSHDNIYIEKFEINKEKSKNLYNFTQFNKYHLSNFVILKNIYLVILLDNK